MSEHFGPRHEELPDDDLRSEFVGLLRSSLGQELSDPSLTLFQEEDGDTIMVVEEHLDEGTALRTTHYIVGLDDTVTKYFDIVPAAEPQTGKTDPEDLAYRDALMATGLTEAEAWAEVAAEKLRRPTGDAAAQILIDALRAGMTSSQEEEALGLPEVSADEMRDVIQRLRAALKQPE